MGLGAKEMAIYREFRREVWIQSLEVEAFSESEAIHKVWMVTV